MLLDVGEVGVTVDCRWTVDAPCVKKILHSSISRLVAPRKKRSWSSVGRTVDCIYIDCRVCTLQGRTVAEHEVEHILEGLQTLCVLFCKLASCHLGLLASRIAKLQLAHYVLRHHCVTIIHHEPRSTDATRCAGVAEHPLLKLVRFNHR